MKSKILNKDFTFTAVHNGVKSEKAERGWTLQDTWKITIEGEEFDYFSGIGLRSRKLSEYKFNPKEKQKAKESGNINVKFGEIGLYKNNEINLIALDKMTEIVPPSIDDVLYCLVSDADVLNYESFEEWAECIGYNPDSRADYKIFGACQANAFKTKNFLDIEEAQEKFQDY